MIAVIGGGGGFKGLGTYLLHDENGQTAERVAWTSCHNLDTDDPDRAAGRMIHTFESRDALKEAAGIKATGRKVKEPLSHIVLSWHADDEPTREQMQAAGLEALTALKAEGYQALFVAHNDREQQHLHIMLNRISPEDGRALNMRQEQKKLQAWALDYEKRHGQDHCPKRQEKAEAAAKGEPTDNTPRIPRHLYELQNQFRKEAASNDNLPPFERFLREQRHADGQLKAATRQMHQGHRDELKKLSATLKTDKQRLWEDRQSAWQRLEEQERQILRRQFAERKMKARSEWRSFHQNERDVSGWFRNVAQAVRGADIGERGRLAAYWGAVTDRGERQAILAGVQKRERDLLYRNYRQRLQEGSAQLKASHATKLEEARSGFLEDRARTLTRQAQEKQANAQAWQQRKADRSEAYRQFQERQRAAQARSAFARTFDQATRPGPAPQKAKPMPYTKDGAYIDPTAPEPKPARQPERPRDPGPSYEAQKAGGVLPEKNAAGLDAEPVRSARSEWRDRAAAKAQADKKAQARNLSLPERAEQRKQEGRTASKDRDFER